MARLPLSVLISTLVVCAAVLVGGGFMLHIGADKGASDESKRRAKLVGIPLTVLGSVGIIASVVLMIPHKDHIHKLASYLRSASDTRPV